MPINTMHQIFGQCESCNDVFIGTVCAFMQKKFGNTERGDLERVLKVLGKLVLMPCCSFAVCFWLVAPAISRVTFWSVISATSCSRLLSGGRKFGICQNYRVGGFVLARRSECGILTILKSNTNYIHCSV
jgi:hypothetical protein